MLCVECVECYLSAHYEDTQAAELDVKLEETKAAVETQQPTNDNDEDEVDDFVIQLDKAYQGLDDAKARKVEYENTIIELQMTKESLEEKLKTLENKEPTEEEEAIRQVKEAMATCAEDVVKQHKEIAELKEHMAQLNETKLAAEQARDESHKLRSKLQAEVTREEAQATRVASSCEHQVEPVISTLRSELSAANERSSRLDEDLEATKEALAAAEVRSVELDKQLAKAKRAHTSQAAQETQFKNDLVRLQQVEVGLQADRVELASSMKLAKGDARALVNAVMTAEREKEKGLLRLKQTRFKSAKVEGKLQTLTTTNVDLQTQHKHLKRKIKEMAAKLETTAEEKARMETTLMTGKALKEAELKAYKSILQQRQVADKQLAAAQKENYELERARKKAERMMDQADADSKKAQVDARQAELEFADVKSAMTEARERLIRLESAETDVKDLYQAMKNEKNKFASQTTALAQRLTDMNDKTKMLANEQEILRASALEKMVAVSLLESKIMEEHRVREKILTEESECRSRNKELRDIKRAHNADAKLVSFFL